MAEKSQEDKGLARQTWTNTLMAYSVIERISSVTLSLFQSTQMPPQKPEASEQYTLSKPREELTYSAWCP